MDFSFLQSVQPAVPAESSVVMISPAPSLLLLLLLCLSAETVRETTVIQTSRVKFRHLVTEGNQEGRRGRALLVILICRRRGETELRSWETLDVVFVEISSKPESLRTEPGAPL